MNTVQDLESLAFMSDREDQPIVLEAYEGTSVVAWHGNIGRQLDDLIASNEAGRNFPYADKLRTFANTWKNYQISGSVNREDIEPLLAATSQLASDSWKLRKYFSLLQTQLQMLLASEEQLPRGVQKSEPPRPERGSRRPPPEIPSRFGAEKGGSPLEGGAEAGEAPTPPAGAG